MLRIDTPVEFSFGAGRESGKIFIRRRLEFGRETGSGDAKNARSDENAVSESAEL